MEGSGSLKNSRRLQHSIDQLPDELLTSIVSFLPLKEAGRTSVLARRWRYFWKFCRVLDFDGSEMLQELVGRRVFLGNERTNFVDWVNGVLNLHLSETIDEFRVSFDLNDKYAVDIYRWTEFAFAKRVKRLELNMVRRSYALQECAFFRPTQHSICEALVSLRLIKVGVDGEDLHFFISNCPFLEELHVESAIRFQCLSSNCQAVRLRRLAIIDCGSFERLEICSPNLVSYTFLRLWDCEVDTTMALKRASSLIHLSLGRRMLGDLSRNLLELSGCFSRLETLTIQTFTMMLDDEELEFPDFHLLKKLVLEINACEGGSLLCFTALMNAAPLLSEMVLKMKRDWPVKRRPSRHSDEGQKHQCLKMFEAISFSSRGVGAEIALNVLENAALLEHIIINGKIVKGRGLDLLKAKLCRNIFTH